MSSSAPNSNVRVIDPPAADQLPYKPQPPKDIGFGTMLAGALAAGAFALREMLKAKKLSTLVATPGHSPTLLDVPELGVIPSFQLDNGKEKKWLLPDIAVLRRLQPPRSSETATELVIRQERPSMAAEAFRFTLTSLFLRARVKDKATFVITSAGPGEGKTSSASNLAAAMAEMGKRVLLIDADMRKSRLHKVFQLNDGPGLRDILLSPVEVEKLQMDEYLQPTELEGLWLLASGGTSSKSPAPMLFSQRLPIVLARLKDQFDIILIDTAPVMHFGDARLVGPHTDGVIIVMRSGVTSQESILAIRQRFWNDRTRVIGTILNDWTTPDDSAYSYQGYAGYYFDAKNS